MRLLSEITGLFSALSDATRLRIVRLMAANKEQLCVCELVDCLEEPQYHVSRHLKELRECGLLQAQRDGRWMYYSLNEQDPFACRVAELVASLPAEAFAQEQENFAERMKIRVEGRCRIGIQKEHLSSEPLGAVQSSAHTQSNTQNRGNAKANGLAALSQDF